MRVCNHCNKEKELSEFHKKGENHQYMCKECRKDYIRAHYAKNKEKYLAKSVESKDRLVEWLEEIKKGLKCEECGEDHIACLDFHHTNPNEKDFAIAQFKQHSREKVLEEIKKCKVLCSNCHRKLHWNERNIGR